VCGWIGVGEAADFPCLIVDQPANTLKAIARPSVGIFIGCSSL
tara:strand:- start:1606 stop:1734 length:129 start_codon:yes stop_codon:yes gene_type:complete